MGNVPFLPRDVPSQPCRSEASMTEASPDEHCRFAVLRHEFAEQRRDVPRVVRRPPEPGPPGSVGKRQFHAGGPSAWANA